MSITIFSLCSCAFTPFTADEMVLGRRKKCEKIRTWGKFCHKRQEHVICLKNSNAWYDVDTPVTNLVRRTHDYGFAKV
jgi:hypothetical protein